MNDDHEITLAYLAGIVDGDGTIGIKRSTYGMRHGTQGHPSFSERVCVKQVTPEAIELLHGRFGGYRRIDGPTAAYGRPLFVWQVTDASATRCLEALRPYLLIKRAQAENALTLREVKRWAWSGRRDPDGTRRIEMTARMEALCERAHELNAVGTGGGGGDG